MMSIVAMIGGILLHWMLKNYLATSEDGPPLFRHLQGQRIFERVLVTLSWNWARKAEAFLSTRRLQPQLRIVVAVAVLAAAWPIFASGLQSGSLGPQPVDPPSITGWQRLSFWAGRGSSPASPSSGCPRPILR